MLIFKNATNGEKKMEKIKNALRYNLIVRPTTQLKQNWTKLIAAKRSTGDTCLPKTSRVARKSSKTKRIAKTNCATQTGESYRIPQTQLDCRTSLPTWTILKTSLHLFKKFLSLLVIFFPDTVHFSPKINATLNPHES